MSERSFCGGGHRHVGLSRPRPVTAQGAARADGSRRQAGGPQAPLEVAADPAEQRGAPIRPPRIAREMLFPRM